MPTWVRLLIIAACFCFGAYAGPAFAVKDAALDYRLLEFVNHPAVTAAILDDLFMVSSEQARGIVLSRPIRSADGLAAAGAAAGGDRLDPDSFRWGALLRAAGQWSPPYPVAPYDTATVSGVRFTPAQAASVLAFVNNAGRAALDSGAGSPEAADRIIAARPLGSLPALDAVSGIDGAALRRLVSEAARWRIAPPSLPESGADTGADPRNSRLGGEDNDGSGGNRSVTRTVAGALADALLAGAGSGSGTGADSRDPSHPPDCDGPCCAGNGQGDNAAAGGAFLDGILQGSTFEIGNDQPASPPLISLTDLIKKIISDLRNTPFGKSARGKAILDVLETYVPGDLTVVVTGEKMMPSGRAMPVTPRVDGEHVPPGNALWTRTSRAWVFGHRYSREIYVGVDASTMGLALAAKNPNDYYVAEHNGQRICVKKTDLIHGLVHEGLHATVDGQYTNDKNQRPLAEEQDAYRAGNEAVKAMGMEPERGDAPGRGYPGTYDNPDYQPVGG